MTLKRGIRLFVLSFIVLFFNTYLFSNSNGIFGAIIRTLALQSLMFSPLFAVMLLTYIKRNPQKEGTNLSDNVKKFLETFAYSYLSFIVVLSGTKFIVMLNNKETIKNTFTSEFFYSLIWAIPFLMLIVLIRGFVVNYREKKTKNE